MTCSGIQHVNDTNSLHILSFEEPEKLLNSVRAWHNLPINNDENQSLKLLIDSTFCELLANGANKYAAYWQSQSESKVERLWEIEMCLEIAVY